MHDVRAAAASLALRLKWNTLFSIRFFAGKIINLLDLESLINLLRRIEREGIRAKRLLVLVDSRVILGVVSEGRSSSRKLFFLLRKLGFWCLASDIALELLWMPTWTNPADVLSRNKPFTSWLASLLKLSPPSSTVFASVHVISELDLLREQLSAAALTAEEHVRKLESSGAFSCSKMKLVYAQNETSQMAHVVASNSTPSDVRLLSRESVKKRLEGRENRRDSSLVPDTMLISSRFHLYFSELVSRHFIVFMGSRPEYWRNELLYRADDIERHPGPKRARPLRGRDVPIQDILPTTA